ncbi:MAG: alpha/beta hydrolase [Roseiflexaceae bacterium]
MKTTTSKDGTTLAYDVYGNGPALIYITGASCFRSFMPVVQDAKAFAQEFTVYNYDRRGRGDSSNTLPWSVEGEVEDIEALIDMAGGKASLYGHSSGAVLALEAALRLGDKVQKIVIYDASYVHDQTEKLEYDQLSQKIHQLLRNGKNAEAMKGFLKGIGMPKAFVFLLPLFPGWKTMKALAPTLAYDIALTSDVPPVKRVMKVAVPTQIIIGQKSPASIHNVADQLVKAIPNAKFAILAGQDHMVSAKVLLPMLVGFLK